VVRHVSAPAIRVATMLSVRHVRRSRATIARHAAHAKADSRVHRVKVVSRAMIVRHVRRARVDFHVHRVKAGSLAMSVRRVKAGSLAMIVRHVRPVTVDSHAKSVRRVHRAVAVFHAMSVRHVHRAKVDSRATIVRHARRLVGSRADRATPAHQRAVASRVIAANVRTVHAPTATTSPNVPNGCATLVARRARRTDTGERRLRDVIRRMDRSDCRCDVQREE
jgi:hypothetical protein